MLKKIIFYNLLFLSALLNNSNSAESGGMPQLNPEFWISQVFWLIITFGFLFLILSKIILPKVSNNLENRKTQIKENIEIAEKQRLESDNKIKEFEKIILDSKLEAKNYFNKAREKIINDLDKKKLKLETEINSEIQLAEKEIIDLKNNSSKKINSIAVQTCEDIIMKLIGVHVNNSSISAIVEDLSKKNKDKYNGV
tara:strand:- start:1440 stop:2030 length:591 start_codon:yes stop_codon:yes gene_type:complete